MMEWLLPLLPSGPLTFVDLGCGIQIPKETLPADWTYVPVDRVSWGKEDTILIDLSKPEAELPKGDIAFVAGVLETIKPRKALLVRLLDEYRFICFSWSHAGLPGAVPHGHWTNQTFIAALRCSGLTAPWIIPGAMDRQAFDIYVETQLAPTLGPGDVVILDNLKVHDSAKAKMALAERGAWFLFLPPYSPDLNPIEMAFAKLKAHLRAAGARTYEALWRAVGNICELFEPKECWNFFRHAGYVST